MKLISITAAAIAAITALAPASAAATAYDNFPLEDNNLWVYLSQDQNGATTTRELSVTAEAYLGGGWYANRLDGMFRQPQWVWDHVYDDRMWVHDGTDFQEIFDFAAAPGDTFDVIFSACDGNTVEYQGQVGSYDVPAGSFVGTYEFDMGWTGNPPPHVRCDTTGFRHVSFAEGIGPVYAETSTTTDELLYAYVDGQVVAAGHNDQRVLDGVETAMVVSADTFASGDLASIALIVRNVDSGDKTFGFATGQRIEFDLFDNATGEHVRSWSDGRFFTQATNSFTLAPAETEVLFGQLELTDFDTGAPLSGSYQLVGYLNTPGAGKLSVDITIEGPAAGSFACGDETCDAATEYCQSHIPGVPPPPFVEYPLYSCNPLPTECAAAPSCDACFGPDVGIYQSCAGDAATGLTLSTSGI